MTATPTELICDVCGERQAVGVAAVPGVPISVAYCKLCLQANAHPLYVLIGNTALCGGFDQCADWWQGMVESTLQHLGKTREWFDVEVLESMLQLDDIPEPDGTTVSFDEGEAD